MATVRALVTIQHSSQVAENVSVNTFHFNTASPPDGLDLNAIVAALKTFYDTFTTTGVAVANMLSVNMSSGNRSIKLYNLADAKPRAPLVTDISTMASVGTGSFPHEVALCLSFTSSAPSGVPRSRRRGRIYLGPLSDQSTFLSRTGGDVRPSVLARNTLAASALRMKNDVDIDWSTFSTVDGVASNVLAGWVDDAYDTQRRRGTKPTSRTIW